MKVLIGCEESQEVCKAFRALGHEAYSCDLLPCSGWHPEWHIQDDLRSAILAKKWEIIIMHCPCTYTAVSGNRSYSKSPLRLKGAMFTKEVYELACSVCDCVALEQPKTIMQKYIGPRSQIIHPWMFGHPERKQTWLWLKNLPLLSSTKDVFDEMILLPKQKQNRIHWMGSNKGKERSKTFPGIAKAMAEQWSEYLLNPKVAVTPPDLFSTIEQYNQEKI